MLLQGLRGLRAVALHLPRGDHAAEKERPEDEHPEVHPQRRVVPVSRGQNRLEKCRYIVEDFNVTIVVGVERQTRTTRKEEKREQRMYAYT